jgi:hypothetical protein
MTQIHNVRPNNIADEAGERTAAAFEGQVDGAALADLYSTDPATVAAAKAAIADVIADAIVASGIGAP